MSDWYILDDEKNPVRCDDHDASRRWIASLPEEQRTSIGCRVDYWTDGDVSVSTVFLGLDHGFDGEVPIVFETMIFGGDRDQDCERYATWGEAKAGHARIVQELQCKKLS